MASHSDTFQRVRHFIETWERQKGYTLPPQHVIAEAAEYLSERTSGPNPPTLTLIRGGRDDAR